MAFKDALRCNAKAKRTGEQCKSPAMLGSTKCRVHGGKTPKGAASPHFKHGRLSSHMPTRLAAIYNDLENNPELPTLERNLGIREAFLREGLETLKDAGDPASAWKDLMSAYEVLMIGVETQDFGRVISASRTMGLIIDERNRYHEKVKELNNTLSEQRKDIQAKARIELAKEHAVTTSEVMTLIGGIVSIIGMIVTDREQRFAIVDGIDRLLIGTEKTSSIVIQNTDR